MHDRGTVEGYTGCPSVAELAAILGVFVHGCGGKKAQTKEGCRPVWEEPRVLTFEDVIVPTTSCHGLQPLVTSSSPKVGANDTITATCSVHLLFTVRQR
jgi:hypothetical protein